MSEKFWETAGTFFVLILGDVWWKKLNGVTINVIEFQKPRIVEPAIARIGLATHIHNTHDFNRNSIGKILTRWRFQSRTVWGCQTDPRDNYTSSLFNGSLENTIGLDIGSIAFEKTTRARVIGTRRVV